MTFTDPFTVDTSFTSSILTNIASAIVKYHTKDLEETFVGRLLKWAGLLEPDFNDRLCNTIIRALKEFLQRYPDYPLREIEAFFRDSAVSQQLSDYILDRTSPNESEIQQALDRHIHNNHSTITLSRQRYTNAQKVICDFLVCYRHALSLQLSIAEMVLLLEVLDVEDTLLAEMRADEARTRTFLEQLLQTSLSPHTLQSASRDSRRQGVLELIQELDTAKLAWVDEAQQTIEKRLQSLPDLFTEGLCGGRILQAAPQYYFVSHDFPPDILVDWREMLSETLVTTNTTTHQLTPYFAGDTLPKGYQFCDTCERLYVTRFSLFLLTEIHDKNVYLELGIAIGLGTPFLLIQTRNVQIPTILEGLGRYVSDGIFRTMRRELPEKLGKIEEYDFAVIRQPNQQPATKSKSGYLIAAGNLHNDEDIEERIVESINMHYPDMNAILFSHLPASANTSWMLERLIELIQTTRFAIYRVNRDCSAVTFLSLGISIALNRPFLMIRERGREIPSGLYGIGGIYTFPNLTALTKDLVVRHKSFFDRYI